MEQIVHREWSVEGLPGPTHNYAGLAWGNVASQTHSGRPSNPQEAALQGIRKMRTLVARGVPVAFLPPHERPCVATLRALGFAGDDARVLERAAREAPELLAMASSASAMWTANAATVSAAPDCADGRVHLSVANLVSKSHRAIEAATTYRLLQAAFPDRETAMLHAALPATSRFGDEGAANFMRLCAHHGAPGLEVFVYGRRGDGFDPSAPHRYPARQTREAGEAIARRHGLNAQRTLHLRQRAEVIDAGVFHNDVIAVANENVLLYHEDAFASEDALLAAARGHLGEAFVPLRISRAELSVEACVRSYLFNSQLITLPEGGMLLVAPEESRTDPQVRAALERLVAADNPLGEVIHLDVRQSMQGGGGPACMRLRVVLSDAQAARMHPGFQLDAVRLNALEAWVRRHYRDRLLAEDLADPALLEETRRALDELCAWMGTGSLYPFQG